MSNCRFEQNTLFSEQTLKVFPFLRETNFFKTKFLKKDEERRLKRYLAAGGVKLVLVIVEKLGQSKVCNLHLIWTLHYEQEVATTNHSGYQIIKEPGVVPLCVKKFQI